MEELFYNKYRKEERLGRGASSEVWRVTDVQTGVVQALKIFNPAIAISEDGKQMLIHEFALTANINHQNLLRTLFFGIWEEKPFLVMPYCGHGSLKGHEGQFSSEDAWRLLRDLGSALAFLHRQSRPIIHQDIKPDNILIGDDRSFLLTDFGVSAHARAETRATMSKWLTSAGTVAYMAPERFTDSKKLRLSSDIWSLGAMTYEMLTGEVPFSLGHIEGGECQNRGVQIPELPQTVEPELRQIIYRCLSKDPDGRPTAEELHDEAARRLAPVKTSPAPKPIFIISALLCVLAAACVAVVLFIDGKDEPQTQPEPTVWQMLQNTQTAQKGWQQLRHMVQEQDPHATYLMSRILFKSNNKGDYCPDSVKAMKKALGITPDNKQAHELLKKAIELDPSNYQALYELANDYFGGKEGNREGDRIDCVQRDFRLALEYYEKALPLAKNQKDSYYEYQDDIEERIQQIKDIEQ